MTCGFSSWRKLATFMIKIDRMGWRKPGEGPGIELWEILLVIELQR
jgi:hypothetical protein